MSIKVSFNEYKKMQWKNKLGVTYEIDIYPSNSTLSDLDFYYRISMAEVSAENNFSKFPGYNRLLTILSGSGITFNDEQIITNEIKLFKGDLNICSRPIIENEKNLDFGVIYDPSKVQVSMEICSFSECLKKLNTHEKEYLIDSFQYNTYFITKEIKESDFSKIAKFIYIGISYI